MNEEKIWSLSEAHQWTNGGDEVLIVKHVSLTGEAYGGFKWPLEIGAEVKAPDWTTTPSCGGGLHGWPWGLSLGDGKNCEWSACWIVFGAKPEDVVNLGGKCKAKRGVIRLVGSWVEATAFVLAGQMNLVSLSASGAASATGASGAASATGARGAASATGESGAASATGWSGAASATRESGAASATGWSGAASATGARGAASATGGSGAASATGWSGAASATGERGAASATGARGAASATGASGAASATGARGAASATGESGAASATGWSGAAVVTGLYGRAKAGKYGCIALAWWNPKEERGEMRCALIGCGDGSDGNLKADTWYRLNSEGEFTIDGD